MKKTIKITLFVALSILAALAIYSWLHGRYTEIYFPGLAEYILLPMRHLVVFSIAMPMSAGALYFLLFQTSITNRLYLYLADSKPEEGKTKLVLVRVAIVLFFIALSSVLTLVSDFWGTLFIIGMLVVAFVFSVDFIITYKLKEHRTKSELSSSGMSSPAASVVAKPATSNAVAILYYAAALLTPWIFLFIQHNHNRVLTHMPFSYTLIWAGIFSVAGLGLFLLLRLIIRSFEARLMIIVVFWLGFWFFGSMHATLQSYIGNATYTVLLSALIVVLTVLTALMLKVQPHLEKMQRGFSILAVVLCLMFLFNFIPELHREIILLRTRGHIDEDGYDVHGLFRTSWNIDPSLPSPDIYWFWVDGMLSFEAVEDFFGIPHDNERYVLERRGFIIYDYAILNTAHTEVSLPIFFSPGFYDSFFGFVLEQVSDFTNIEEVFSTEVIRLLNRRGISTINEVAPHNEVFRAFMAADYEVVVNVDVGWSDRFPFHILYDRAPTDRPLGIPCEDVELNLWNRMSTGDFARLLVATTPLSTILNPEARIQIDFSSIPDHSSRLPAYSRESERHLYNTLIDSFHITGPKFSFLFIEYAHNAYWSIPNRYYTYPPAHDFAVHVLLNAIDIILDSNPDAVIVLQSDHGIHAQLAQLILYEAGYPMDTIAYLQRSVFSAVRIPELYGGLDAPLSPRNISRELVNRFVGQNYELLSYS